MTTIVYLHGFLSSPSSAKAVALGRSIAAISAADRPRYLVPALSHDPAEAIAGVLELVARETPDPESLTFVGSSLGGFYATHLAERLGTRAVLINPAIRPYDDLRPYAGWQSNLHTGERFIVTAAHFETLASLAVRRITRPSRYLLLVQSGDEVLDYRQAVAFYAGAWQHVEGGGDHGFQRFDAQIPAILRFAGALPEPT